MPAIRVLVANEPRAYRDAVASYLQALRPELDSIVEDPIDLDASLLRHAPYLVLCSRATERLLTDTPAWIILYPSGATLVVASIGGLQRTSLDVDVDHLLALIDESIRHATALPS
jgi:hypothetical protein